MQTVTLVFSASLALFAHMTMTLFARERCRDSSGIKHAGVRYMLCTCLSVCDRLTAWSSVLTSFRFLHCPAAVLVPQPCCLRPRRLRPSDRIIICPPAPPQPPPDSSPTPSAQPTPDQPLLLFYFMQSVILRSLPLAQSHCRHHLGFQ